ncbi:MAG: hypothetical protein J7647_08305 [Cyanobacteria bacterium SBLK]|nr:hypothetical protein [Cyanobacteria bacterium SBLK]
MESNQYSPDSILRIVGGWVQDEDGATDLTDIDLQIQDSQGTILHDTSTRNLTSVSWSENWVSFSHDFNLANLSISDGNYVIKGIANDRAGAISEVFSRSFAIASPDLDLNEAPSNFSFNLANNHYTNSDTLNLSYGWLKDGNGVEDIDKIEWAIWQEGSQIVSLENITEFISATWDDLGTWANFSYSVEFSDLGLESGEYSLRGIAYDRAGESSNSFERTFILEAIETVPVLLFNLNRTTILPTENLSITEGFVQNEAGIDEIKQIVLKLIKNNGSSVDLGAIDHFTPSSEDDRWGSFDGVFNTSDLGLVAGEYKLQGIVRDRMGRESELVERIFTVTSPNDGNSNNDLEFAWATVMGDANNQHMHDIEVAIDSEGNSYITGTLSGTMDFDPGEDVYSLTSRERSDIYITKLDKEGKFLWAKLFGSAGFEYNSKIAIDSQDNVYLTGLFQNTIDFDPGREI